MFAGHGSSFSLMKLGFRGWWSWDACSQSSGSQSVLPRPAAAASPGGWLEPRALRPRPDLLTQTPRAGPRHLEFNKPSWRWGCSGESEKHQHRYLAAEVSAPAAACLSGPQLV